MSYDRAVLKPRYREPAKHENWPAHRESDLQASHARFFQAALHKLAQPLTAALWMSELKGEMAPSPVELDLDRELRRAAKTFRFMAELFEERQRSAACLPIRLAELFSDSLADAGRGLGPGARALPMPDLACRGNRAALDRVLHFILRALDQAAVADGALKISVHLPGRGCVELHFTVPSTQGERMMKEFSLDAHPFEAREFLFESRELPEAARIQALLEGMGGSLAALGSAAKFTLVLYLQIASLGLQPCIATD